MRTKLVRVFVALAAAATITLLILEIALRFVLGGAEQGDLYQFRNAGLHDGRCVGLKPGANVEFTGFMKRIAPVHMEVNALGYRGPERPLEKPPGVFRIAAVGDSFTYGFSVPLGEAMPDHLELVLRQTRSIEVFNFGIPGAQLVDLIPQATLFAARWHPDLVLVILFWNDLDQPLCAWTSPPYSMIAALARRIYLFRIPLLVTVLFGNPVTPRTERLETLKRGFTDLKSAMNGAGARLAVVVLGDPMTRETDHMSPTASIELRTTLDSLSIPWLDARTWVSRDTAQQPLPRIPFDGHFTPAGNRMAAERIGVWLDRVGLVPNGK